MWEKTRVDGTRKLKYDAVPTLFSFSKKVRKRKTPTDRVQAFATMKQQKNENGEEILADTLDIEDNEALPVLVADEAVWHSKVKLYEKVYKKLLIKYRNSQKCLRNARQKIKKIRNFHFSHNYYSVKFC